MNLLTAVLPPNSKCDANVNPEGFASIRAQAQVLHCLLDTHCLGCSKPLELLQQHQGDGQAWGCPGCPWSCHAPWLGPMHPGSDSCPPQVI